MSRSVKNKIIIDDYYYSVIWHILLRLYKNKNIIKFVNYIIYIYI
jgi:hypothetical protein